MSHELRTPLNAVIGFGQLLELDELDPRQAEAVGQILKAGRHLLELINEVLDISRIESGTMSISLEPVHLGSVLAEALSLIRPLADDAEVRLVADPAEPADLHVLADQQRLKQVLINLLSNAVKYNRRGGEVSRPLRRAALGARGGRGRGHRARHERRAARAALRALRPARGGEQRRRGHRPRAVALEGPDGRDVRVDDGRVGARHRHHDADRAGRRGRAGGPDGRRERPPARARAR